MFFIFSISLNIDCLVKPFMPFCDEVISIDGASIDSLFQFLFFQSVVQGGSGHSYGPGADNGVHTPAQGGSASGGAGHGLLQRRQMIFHPRLSECTSGDGFLAQHL